MTTGTKKGGLAILIAAGAAIGGLFWWFNRKTAGAAPVETMSTIEGVVTETGADMGGVNEIFGPGLPVVGAVVTIGGKVSDPTGQDGRYTITGLTPDMQYDGEVVAEGYEPEMITLLPYVGTNTLDVNLTVVRFASYG